MKREMETISLIFLRESRLRIPSTRGGEGVDFLTMSRETASLGERDRRRVSFGCCFFLRRSIVFSFFFIWVLKLTAADLSILGLVWWWWSRLSFSSYLSHRLPSWSWRPKEATRTTMRAKKDTRKKKLREKERSKWAWQEKRSWV